MMSENTRSIVRTGRACLLALTAASPILIENRPHTPALTMPNSQEAGVSPLMTKELKDVPGREVLMLTVTYPPGAADAAHRHFAHAFVYVLEGSIVMQVKGGKQVTLHRGDTFYEGIDDIHVVGRNASATAPARFVVFLLKRTGAPLVVPEPAPSY